jgi:hypothetical protein
MMRSWEIYKIHFGRKESLWLLFISGSRPEQETDYSVLVFRGFARLFHTHGIVN